MRKLGTISNAIAGTLVGTLTAIMVAATLAAAYRDGQMVSALVALGVPTLLLSAIYRGSDKRPLFCLASVAIAGALFQWGPELGLARDGVGSLVISIAALATPIIVDLLFVDRGKQIHFGRPVVRTAEIAFLVALFPLSAGTLLDAHARIVQEDAELIGQLATRIAPEGDSIVVDRLDPKLRDRAQRRITIRTKDRSYELSDAETESVFARYTVRKKTNKRGESRQELVSNEEEERIRLILKLQGTSLPDDVVIESRRGPLTIYEARVPLHKHGS